MYPNNIQAFYLVVESIANIFFNRTLNISDISLSYKVYFNSRQVVNKRSVQINIVEKKKQSYVVATWGGHFGRGSHEKG